MNLKCWMSNNWNVLPKIGMMTNGENVENVLQKNGMTRMACNDGETNDKILTLSMHQR